MSSFAEPLIVSWMCWWENGWSLRTVLKFSVLVIVITWAGRLYSKALNPFRIPSSLNELLAHALVEGFLTIGIVALFLRLGHENLGSIGLGRQDGEKQVRTGIIAGIVIFVLSNFLVTPVLAAFIKSTDAAEGVRHLFQNPYQLPLWLFLGIFGGGVVEELERAFILTRFENLLGKTGMCLALLLTSLFFGLGHLYQGVVAATGTALTGLFYAVVYLRKRSLLEAMVAHACYDSIGITLAYVLYRA